MKSGGILAIALAAILGIWAGVSALNDFHAQVADSGRASTEIAINPADPHGADYEMAQVDKDENAERFDAVIGIVAVLVLIGGIVLVSQGNKLKKAQE